jgi:predicted dehydrogenase
MSEELGVAIIGTGWVSNEHIKAYRLNPHTEVRGIVGVERSQAAAKIRELGLDNCRAYGDVHEMLKDESINIVSVCTPHNLHADQGVACAEAGRHILVEKPMAVDLKGVRALESAVRHARVKSLVSFVLRWNPLFDNIKALLAQGMLGCLSYAEVDYMHGIGPWYSGYEWIRRKASGSNNLLAAGCHAVDALRWFVGGEVVEVFAYANTGPHNVMQFEYETNSITTVKFANCTIGKVGCTIEAMMPYMFNILLVGEEGTIRNNQVFTRRWPGQKNWATIPTILPDTADVDHHPFVAEINHFVDCILNDRESHCNIADAVKTHEICLAMELSAHEGRPVTLPL